MAPSEHLDWFDDNVAWFTSIDLADYQTPVPACPGWNVAYVVSHLAVGVGWGYAYALNAEPDAGDPYPSARWPEPAPSATELRDQFDHLMHSCSQTFRQTDATTPCWTYSGPGVAGFWFRRAAIETTLHRIDVADALDQTSPLSADRAADAIRDAVEFALPFAADLLGVEPPAVELVTDAGSLKLGQGRIAAQVTGTSEDMLSALWGRGHVIEVDGDAAAVTSWLGLVEAAFSGR